MHYQKEQTEPSPNNKSFLLKLYKSNKKPETLSKFKAKFAAKTRHYPELEVFKVQLEEEQNAVHPDFFTEAKNKLFYYRLIFLGFALVFLILSCAVLSFSSNWSYTFFFDSNIKAKWLVGWATISLTISSLACAYFPSSLHEATRHIENKAKRSLRHIYEKQRIQNGLNSFLLWGAQYRKSSALRHIYQELLHKIHERGEETYFLLKKITKTTHLTRKARERLYNQALAELHDKLFFFVHDFKNLNIESFTPLQLG